jgi:hypothetical protein
MGRGKRCPFERGHVLFLFQERQTGMVIGGHETVH